MLLRSFAILAAALPAAAPAGAPALSFPLACVVGRSCEVLNAGFAAGPVSMEMVEAGALAPPGADPPALVAYVRAIELEGGDEIALSLKAPGGAVLAQDRQPLDRDKAQYLKFVGKKRPPAGWPPGTYEADVTVYRGGQAVIRKTFSVRL
jgi:hypothetical protein